MYHIHRPVIPKSAKIVTVEPFVCKLNLLSAGPPVDDANWLTYNVNLLFAPSALTPGIAAVLISLTNEARVVPVETTAMVLISNESPIVIVGFDTVPWCSKAKKLTKHPIQLIPKHLFRLLSILDLLC